MSFPRIRRVALAFVLIVFADPRATNANLLRNASFQDDWLTLLPENQNHHWCYGTGFQNRRDYNPDTWRLSGSWRWVNADRPRGERQLILDGPKSEAIQRVNWILIHDDRKKEGFPDAGGFPSHAAQHSVRPLALVRDLTLKVRVRGQNVPPGAGTIELGLAPPGVISSEDPLGTRVPLTTSVSKALPAGTFEWQWVEASLTAAQWLKAVQPVEGSSASVILPGVASVAVRYTASSGQIEVDRAELIAAPSAAPNLLPTGDFERLDSNSWPEGWSRPSKYRYFPPALYYLFNTWHNATFENRGVVASEELLHHGEGGRSLKMIVPSGDEVQVMSDSITLNQVEPRLIEVSAWVRTDQLNMIQIDALSDTGERLDGFNFIHKAPVSVGTDEWREIRQVFKPRHPVRGLRLVLAARGVNGYTLSDTGETPQANATGTIWWDDVRVIEPESTAGELQSRRATPTAAGITSVAPRKAFLQSLDLGERLFGRNVLRATIVNAGAPSVLSVVWRFTAMEGREMESRSTPRRFRPDEIAAITVPYEIPPGHMPPYAELKGRVSLVDESGRNVAATDLWFSTWTSPLDLELGALYLKPDQKQFVRMNLGFTSTTMAQIGSVRLDLIRRSTSATLRSLSVAAKPSDITAQRERIPVELREDFTNLLLTELDVSELPVQPFSSPERNWLVRATVVDLQGRVMATIDSQPFCRQARRPDQAGVASVRIDRDNLLYVNNEPFLPWGVGYGHVPVYDGLRTSAQPAFRDLRNLPGWGIYDGFTTVSSTRASSDLNSVRYVAGALADPVRLQKIWNDENQMAATSFVAKAPVFSHDELVRSAGGEAALAANLAFIKQAPMVASSAPGIEEAFGLFHTTTPEQLAGLSKVAAEIRAATGKPVMVSHGGYWNRFEFEKVPFFDIFDPETEPLYPANLHTDLMPLIAGQAKTIWLRPQMYEDVPYERWRFHAFVEAMRGARGFQMAHGPGDASLFRGLGGELDGLKRVLWSTDPGPSVTFSPAIEQWVRRAGGRTYIIAATTHGMTFGGWRWADGIPSPHGRVRVTEGATVDRNEANSYGIDQRAVTGPSHHGIQYLPDPKRYGAGSRLVQWVWVDPAHPPTNLTAVLKADGRFTQAASWGQADSHAWRGSELLWFLRSFYRHAVGFLGWGEPLLDAAREYAPAVSRSMGSLPARGEWTRLEIPLADVGATGKLVDGIGFLHDDGRVLWGETSIVDERNEAQVIWGDSIGPNATQLANTRVEVAGLKAGTRIRVLYEDREIVASAGFFVDDFTGRDLYQRFGGGRSVGYGDTPVALHIYEIPNEQAR